MLGALPELSGKELVQLAHGLVFMWSIGWILLVNLTVMNYKARGYEILKSDRRKAALGGYIGLFGTIAGFVILSYIGFYPVG